MEQTPTPMSMDIDQGLQERIAARVKSLMEDARIAAVGAGDGIEEEHIEQEAASLVVQSIMADAKDSAAIASIFEGMLVQLGVQLAYRAGPSPMAWADKAQTWLLDGVKIGLSTGIGAPARGAA